MKDVPGRERAREQLGLDRDRPVVGLLPGSRSKEIDRLLPIMLDTAEHLRADRPDLQFVVGAAPGFEGKVRSVAGDADVRIAENATHTAMAASDLLLIASGTATVEAMILNVPMVVTYRVSLFTYLAFAWLMKVDKFAMPNIIAGKEIIPELLQWNATAENLYREASARLAPEQLETTRGDLAAATAKLGGGGASLQAARRVIETIQG